MWRGTSGRPNWPRLSRSSSTKPPDRGLRGGRPRRSRAPWRVLGGPSGAPGPMSGPERRQPRTLVRPPARQELACAGGRALFSSPRGGWEGPDASPSVRAIASVRPLTPSFRYIAYKLFLTVRSAIPNWREIIRFDAPVISMSNTCCSRRVNGTTGGRGGFSGCFWRLSSFALRPDLSCGSGRHAPRSARPLSNSTISLRMEMISSSPAPRGPSRAGPGLVVMASGFPSRNAWLKAQEAAVRGVSGGGVALH